MKVLTHTSTVACLLSILTLGLVVAPVSAASLPTTAPPPPPLNWQPCADSPTRDCATLTVPLDYADLSKGMIDLPVARAKAADTTQPSLGPLLFNLGGPGADATSTIKFGNLTSQFTQELVNRFDIVGFDPRGTSNGVQCFTSPDQAKQYWEMNHLPKTTSEVNTLLTLESKVNQGCVANPGNSPLAEHLDTASAVRDMEQLRRAMSVNTFSYIGFSYGTYIGDRYANLYPGHLRATVFDAVDDHSISDTQQFTAVNGATEYAWHKFKTWCQGTTDCQLHGQNLDDVFAQQLAKARANPIPAPYNPYGNRPVDDWRLNFAIQAALTPGNVTYSWVDEMLYKAEQNDASLASLLYDSATGYNPDTDSYSTYATHRAIYCQDTNWSQLLANASDVQNFETQQKTVSSHFGAANVYQSPVQCYHFPVQPVESSPVASTVGLNDGAHMLLIGATGDILTPYAFTAHIAQQISGSHVLTRTGDGHISLGKSGCVEKAVNNALVRLQFPNQGATCPTDPDLYPPVDPPVLGPNLTSQAKNQARQLANGVTRDQR